MCYRTLEQARNDAGGSRELVKLVEKDLYNIKGSYIYIYTCINSDEFVVDEETMLHLCLIAR